MKAFGDIYRRLRLILLMVTAGLGTTSCIEPPLHLPAEELIAEFPIVITDISVIWSLDVDWKTTWYYDWDNEDISRWGKIEYPEPTSFEIRRYYLGHDAGGQHTQEGTDAFSVVGSSFRRTYQFGYYDLLLWSEIDSKDHTQVVLVDDSSLDEVTATTTITRSANLQSRADANPTALYNQPEIFYSSNPKDIYISHRAEDYDYYDEKEGVWVKKINSTLNPLVYIYLVQIILYNNEDGRVKDINGNGDCAISAFASGTSVNTGHTNNSPCSVYFNTRMKKDLMVKGKKADIIGGKLTTYGLCDMEGYKSGSRAQYAGSRTELPNYLFFELKMSGGSVKTMRADVTDQCQAQSHGGVITVEIDCSTLDNPAGGDNSSIFQPTVEDYNKLDYEIPL